MEYCVLWEEPCGHNEPGVGRFDHCLGWEMTAWASLVGRRQLEVGDEGTRSPSTPDLQGVKGNQGKSLLLLLKQQHAHHPSLLSLSSLAPSCVKFTAGGWTCGSEVTDDDDFPVHWLKTYFPGFILFLFFENFSKMTGALTSRDAIQASPVGCRGVPGQDTISRKLRKMGCEPRGRGQSGHPITPPGSATAAEDLGESSPKAAQWR